MEAHFPHVSDRPWVARYPKDVPTHLAYPSEPAYWLLEDAAERFPDPRSRAATTGRY